MADRPTRKRNKDGAQETRTFQSTFQSGEVDQAGEVRYLYQDAISGLRTEMQDYWLNHSYLHGNQWLFPSKISGQLDEVPDDPDRVRATINRLWPNTRTIISTLMQRTLHFEVMPTEVDDSHIRGAKLAESVIRSVADYHQWETLREDLYYAVWKGGTAAICVDWDKTAGEIMSDNTPGDSPVKEGDTYEQHMNITQFCVEPGARYPERARWWIRAVALPPGEVKDMYDLEELPPSDATAGLAPFHRKLMSYDRGSDSKSIDLTLVLTYYQRPSDDDPEGMVCTVVDNEVVEKVDWPFPFKDRLNLVIIRETPRENRWTGDTVLTAARPVQTLLNVSWSSIVEHMKLAGNARLLIPMSSIDIMNDATDLAGELLPYNDALPVKPSYLSPPQMPEWWIQQPDRLAAEIDDIMGVHAISRGDAPANIESGFGLTILAEKDNTPTSRLTKEAAGAFSRLGTLVLEIYEQETMKTKIKRKSLVNVPGNSPMSIQWNGEDFKGQTRASVPEDAILPRSRAAQMEMAKDMLQAQLITTIPEFIAVAELPGQRDILAVTSPDVDRARRENANFGHNRQSEPKDFDDHAAHIHEHNVYRKTIDYEMLDEEGQELVDDHIKAHEVLAAQEMGRGRAMGAIDPALAEAPTASEGPVVAPVEMTVPGQGQAPPDMQNALPPGPMGAPGLTVDQATDELMASLQQLG